MFELRVLRWTDEALVLIDGHDQLASLGRDPQKSGKSGIGRCPEDALGPGTAYLATAEPRDVLIARCSCGELGCGGLIARIFRQAQVVVWDQLRRGSDARDDVRALGSEPFFFDARQYEAAVLGPGDPVTDWQPTSRRAAALVSSRLGGWEDARLRLRGVGVEGLGDQHGQVKAILGRRGDVDRAILRRCLRLRPDESSEELAERVATYVKSGALVDDQLVERTLISTREGRWGG